MTKYDNQNLRVLKSQFATCSEGHLCLLIGQRDVVTAVNNNSNSLPIRIRVFHTKMDFRQLCHVVYLRIPCTLVSISESLTNKLPWAQITRSYSVTLLWRNSRCSIAHSSIFLLIFKFSRDPDAVRWGFLYQIDGYQVGNKHHSLYVI